MKTLILFFVLLGSFIAQAADVHGICMTSFAPSTTFEMKTEGDKVNFEITNHNGGLYAPFWNSNVVPFDLSALTEKADMILKLDRGFKTVFPVSSCKWSGENKFSCVDFNQKTSVNGISVKPWALYSAVVTDSSFAGDFKYVEMTVSFQAEQKEFRYTMRYPIEECLLSEKPLDGLRLKQIKSNKK